MFDPNDTWTQEDADWLKFTQEQNAALAGHESGPTHQVEAVDNAMQSAGVELEEIPSKYVK